MGVLLQYWKNKLVDLTAFCLGKKAKRLFQNHICWGCCGMHSSQKTDLSVDYNQASYATGPTFT